jgi:hypothetical protein
MLLPLLLSSLFEGARVAVMARQSYLDLSTWSVFWGGGFLYISKLDSTLDVVKPATSVVKTATSCGTVASTPWAAGSYVGCVA